MFAPLLAALQDTAVVQVDVARVLFGAVSTLGAILLAIVAFFLKGIYHEFRTMGVQLAKVTTTLFGPDGRNGMRSELRRTRELQVRHDRLLVEIARVNGIDAELDLDTRAEE